MKTSELIRRLFESLISHGDLDTNIINLSWYCPKEGGSFEKVLLKEAEDSEVNYYTIYDIEEEQDENYNR